MAALKGFLSGEADERCLCGQCWQRAGGCEEGSKEERMESLEEAMLSGFFDSCPGPRSQLELISESTVIYHQNR